MNKKNQILKIALVAIAIFIVVNNIIFSPGNILSWDVFGYYLYLPLKFIYNDLGLNDNSIISVFLVKYHITEILFQAI